MQQTMSNNKNIQQGSTFFFSSVSRFATLEITSSTVPPMISVLIYIIFFVVVVTPQSETVKVTNITSSLFEQLRQ